MEKREEFESFPQGPREYLISPELLAELEQIDDAIFWQSEELGNNFREDITFGAKMWTGFFGLLESQGLQHRPDIRKKFDELGDIVLADKVYNPEQQVVALSDLKTWMRTLGFTESQLSASAILKEAYLGEAETMKMYGIDPIKNPPFTIGLQLNRDHPLVKEVLEEEDQREISRGSEILRIAMESSPSLKAKFIEFEEATKPPDDRTQ